MEAGEGPVVAAGLKQARIQLTLRPDSLLTLLSGDAFKTNRKIV